LKNISFEVKSGELLAIVGPVGSGKVCHYFKRMIRITIFVLFH